MSTALVVRIVFWLWFIAAALAGQQRLLQRLPPLAIPGIVFGLTAFLTYAYFRFAAVRQWVDALDLRALLLVHITRFVGVYFLVLYRRGELPYAFAVPGGYGDILVAVLALLVIFVPMDAARRTRAITIWNVIGLTDILLVAGTAVRLNLANPFQMRAMTYLPLSLLPTFLVPLIIATHIIIFARLARTARED